MRLHALKLRGLKWVGGSVVLLAISLIHPVSSVVPTMLFCAEGVFESQQVSQPATDLYPGDDPDSLIGQKQALVSKTGSHTAEEPNTVLYGVVSIGVLGLSVALFFSRSRLRRAYLQLEQEQESVRLSREARDLLRERYANLHQMRNHSVLVGGIAHEFNNLLVGVMCNAELLELEAPNLSSYHMERVSQILLSAEKAAELSRKMLAVSATTRDGRRTRQDIQPLLSHVSHVLSAVAGDEYPLSIEFCRKELVTEVDADDFEQVAINLVTHTRKVVQAGSPIQIRCGRESIQDRHGKNRLYGSRKSGGDFVFLEVSSPTGSQLEESVQATVDAFHLDFAKGQRLGLSVVQRIVNAHGGLIHVLGTAESGPKVRVLLPEDPLSMGDRL